MKNTFTILILAFLLSSCSENSKFIGTWYNNSNSCDSLFISKGEDKLVAEYFGSKFPAEVKNGYLEIYGKETLKASLGKQDELLIDGMICSKKTSDNDFSLNGDWKIYECDTKFNWSNISIENDTISVIYGPPIEIIGTLNRISKDSIAVNYEYGAGTISMSKIIDELRDKIDYDKPIAYILPKSKSHFTIEWIGVTIKNQKEKWLERLDDDLYWGEKANDFEYKITFIKE